MQQQQKKAATATMDKISAHGQHDNHKKINIIEKRIINQIYQLFNRNINKLNVNIIDAHTLCVCVPTIANLFMFHTCILNSTFNKHE